MSAADGACNLYFVFTQLPSLDPDNEINSANTNTNTGTNDDEGDTVMQPVTGEIVTDRNNNHNNSNNNSKKPPKDISLQPLADFHQIRTLGTQVWYNML